MIRIPLLHLTGLVLIRVVLRQLHCVFVQIVIFPIPLDLLLNQMRHSLPQNLLVLPLKRILFLRHSKIYTGRLAKPSYLRTYNSINLARDFFHTRRRPSGVFFPSIATVCYLSVQIMASQS